jgi:hypothetical protein
LLWSALDGGRGIERTRARAAIHTTCGVGVGIGRLRAKVYRGMSLFKRRASGRASHEVTLIPSGLVARLEPFGRFEFDPQGSGVDATGHPNAEYALLQTAKQEPDRFLAALASATVPIGGLDRLRRDAAFVALRPTEAR